MVVVLLALAFRSVPDVLFPLIGLSSALIWTYGVMNLLGAKFTALEVAVAPLVLGLGIDYAIHLQRAYAAIRKEHQNPAEAWLRSCARLSVPLLLAVVTTVAAFLANIISPHCRRWRPSATLLAFRRGLRLCFRHGRCRFPARRRAIGCTVKVGNSSHHHAQDSSIGIVALQQKQQVAVSCLVSDPHLRSIGLWGSLAWKPISISVTFVDPGMEIMDVREDLDTNYDSAGWKLLYILFEPVDGATTIPGDSLFCSSSFRASITDLTSNHDVVGTDERIPSPAYEGPYVVLRDAILRNTTFGEAHNLEVFDGDGDVYVIDQALGCNLVEVFCIPCTKRNCRRCNQR